MNDLLLLVLRLIFLEIFALESYSMGKDMRPFANIWWNMQLQIKFNNCKAS